MIGPKRYKSHRHCNEFVRGKDNQEQLFGKFSAKVVVGFQVYPNKLSRDSNILASRKLASSNLLGFLMHSQVEITNDTTFIRNLNPWSMESNWGDQEI